MKFEKDMYKVKVLALIIGVLLFLITPSLALGASIIEWKGQVTVSAPVVYLHDLAYIAGDDPARIAMLKEISMGEAPLPGQTRYFTRDVLQARLLAQGINHLAEGWQLPENVIVTAASQTIAKEQLAAAVSNEIMAKVAYPKSDVTVSFHADLQDVKAAVGEYRILTRFPNGIRYNGPTMVVAEIWIGERHTRDVFLTCTVSALTNVYVLKKAVGNKQFLSNDDINIEKRSVARLPLRALKKDDIFKTYWTRRGLASGTVLTEDMFDIPPVVKRQAQVVIFIDTNAIKLSTLGMAMQDGRPGDVIRVQNVETNRFIMARVIENGRVTPLGF